MSRRLAFMRSIPFLVIGAVALFFRFYRLFSTIRFRGDQGLDLLVIWFMQHGHFPLVGPFLSLPNVFTPPTYYYRTWLIYSMTHSINGVVVSYAVMNIVTMIILIRLAYMMAGRRAALFMGMLFGVSSIMVDHSRTYWQPYPMQLFLALYLVFLWRAQAKHQEMFLWLSTISLQLALSVYPSPLLLLPYSLYQLYRWYRQNGTSRLLVWGKVLVHWGVTFAVVFSPQIYFEMLHGFPTIRTLIMVRPDSPIRDIYVNISQNFFQLFRVFFYTVQLPVIAGDILTVCCIALTVLFVIKYPLSKTICSFLSPGALFIGTVFLVFYPEDVHSHRTWAYFPFLFLGLTFLLDRAYAEKSWQKIGALLALTVFVGFNMLGNLTYIMPSGNDEKNEARRIASYIEKDMQSRHLSTTTAGIFHKVPNDPQNGSYEIYRVLYFLVRDRVMTLSLTPAGNDIDFPYSIPPKTDSLYLVCRWYAPRDIARCITDAGYARTYTVRSDMRIGNSVVYFLETNTPQALSTKIL